MAYTPCFPGWQHRFQTRPLRRELDHLRRCTLDKLEAWISPLLPALPELSAAAASARERPYSVRHTWWCFLWQMLQLNVSCRQVVRQVLAMRVLAGLPGLDPGTSAYCQARARLPQALLERALQVSAQAARQRSAPSLALQGREVKVMDRTALTLRDTAQNQAQYAQLTSQKPGCGFAFLNLLVVWSARGGAIIDHAEGDYHHSEMRLMHQLCPRLTPKDIVIYDRAAGHYMACALLVAQQVDLISRVMVRQINWRQGQRLGPNDRLVRWKKSQRKPPYLPLQQWATLPAELPVRVIRVQLNRRGFRSHELVLVTTLLDPALYPAAEISAAYQRRWRLEMSLDDLKTTLGLERLRCQSPAMVQRELLMLLIAHNLVRAVMALAAHAHAVPLDRLSFTGTLDTLRCFCSAHAQAAPHTRRRLWTAMLGIVAQDSLPHRPNRSEPRVVKRRRKDFPLLNLPRHLYPIFRQATRLRPIKKT